MSEKATGAISAVLFVMALSCAAGVIASAWHHEWLGIYYLGLLATGLTIAGIKVWGRS